MNQKLEKHFRKMLTKQTASPLIDAEYQAELYGQWALEHGVKQITIYSEAKIDWSRSGVQPEIWTKQQPRCITLPLLITF